MDFVHPKQPGAKPQAAAPPAAWSPAGLWKAGLLGTASAVLAAAARLQTMSRGFSRMCPFGGGLAQNQISQFDKPLHGP